MDEIDNMCVFCFCHVHELSSAVISDDYIYLKFQLVVETNFYLRKIVILDEINEYYCIYLKFQLVVMTHFYLRKSVILKRLCNAIGCGDIHVFL